MKKAISQIMFSSLFFVLCNLPLTAQEEKIFNFIGINPSITVEPFYDRGELDINILPFVYQKSFTKRVDLRLTSILNYGIRNNGNEISHFGIESAFPIYFKSKENKNEISKGLFVAPILSLTKNRVDAHNNLGIWIEPGYNLLFDNNFAMSFGLQLGGTYFMFADNTTKWGNHFGIKIIIGRWL